MIPQFYQHKRSQICVHSFQNLSEFLILPPSEICSQFDSKVAWQSIFCRYGVTYLPDVSIVVELWVARKRTNHKRALLPTNFPLVCVRNPSVFGVVWLPSLSFCCCVVWMYGFHQDVSANPSPFGFETVTALWNTMSANVITRIQSTQTVEKSSFMASFFNDHKQLRRSH